MRETTLSVFLTMAVLMTIIWPDMMGRSARRVYDGLVVGWIEATK